MYNMIKSLAILLILLFVCSTESDKNEDNEDVFIPTKEWQIVKKGQKIPKGLHIRINIETGLTEAKLLDENEDKNKALTALPQETPEAIDDKAFLKSTLEEAVRNIKNDDSINPDEIKKIKDQFRSYDDIKKTLNQLNLAPKLDSEVITDLLKRHKQIIKNEKLNKAEILKVIEDLDFLAHQYDNAREFVNQNGFHDIIYNNINSSNVEIKKETLKLMASLMQNNIVPKLHALDTGAVGILLRLINFDPDSGVKVRALTALSSLIRSFPVAQKKFIENGGLTVLSKFFESDDIKIQIKTITMISDLIIEYKWAAKDKKLGPQYAQFNLIKHVLEQNWCENLNKFLFRLLITDKDDHDSVEKCLTAMNTLKKQCSDKYEKSLLESLKKRYEMLEAEIAEENKKEDSTNSTFFQVLKDLCDEILRYVYKNIVKTEL